MNLEHTLMILQGAHDKVLNDLQNLTMQKKDRQNELNVLLDDIKELTNRLEGFKFTIQKLKTYQEFGTTESNDA